MRVAPTLQRSATLSLTDTPQIKPNNAHPRRGRGSILSEEEEKQQDQGNGEAADGEGGQETRKECRISWRNGGLAGVRSPIDSASKTKPASKPDSPVAESNSG